MQGGRRQCRFLGYAVFYLSHIPMSPNEISSAETQVSRFTGPAIAITCATAATLVMIFVQD
jgi:hypothetical protein